MKQREHGRRAEDITSKSIPTENDELAESQVSQPQEIEDSGHEPEEENADTEEAKEAPKEAFPVKSPEPVAMTGAEAWQRRPKAQPFVKETRFADQRRTEFEEQRLAREAANKERQEKIEERDRFRKAMAKARTGGKNGQRKLGRESKVLLERVQKLVGQ